MAGIAGKENNIAYAVCYKEAARLVAAGVVELETPDIGAELAALADLLVEHYVTRLQPEAGGGGGGARKSFGGGGGKAPTKKPSTGFKKQGSTQFGSRTASPKAIRYAQDLLQQKDHDLEVDPDDVEGMGGKDVSDLISALQQYPDRD